MTGRPTCSYCGHKDTYHDREAGFYDVRPTLGKCDVVGCGCPRYRPGSRSA